MTLYVRHVTITDEDDRVILVLKNIKADEAVARMLRLVQAKDGHISMWKKMVAALKHIDQEFEEMFKL